MRGCRFAHIADEAIDFDHYCFRCKAIGNSIEDAVRWYKASLELPPFRVGKQFMWKMDRRYYKTVKYELPKFLMRGMAAGGAAIAGRKKTNAKSAITTVVKQDKDGKVM